MTREEKIDQAINTYTWIFTHFGGYSEDAKQAFEYVFKQVFRDGIEWADENPPKDVVNLNDIWHDASEEPIYGRDIIVIDFDGYALSGALRRVGDNKGVYYNCFCLCDWSVVSKWMYVFDILPGEDQ